jgi:hypothetical protein
MTRLLGRLARTGLRRGFLEGSSTWLVVGAAATALRVVQRIVTEPPVTATFDLKTGDAIEIRAIPPTPR